MVYLCTTSYNHQPPGGSDLKVSLSRNCQGLASHPKPHFSDQTRRIGSPSILRQPHFGAPKSRNSPCDGENSAPAHQILAMLKRSHMVAIGGTGYPPIKHCWLANLRLAREFPGSPCWTAREYPVFSPRCLRYTTVFDGQVRYICGS